MLTTRIVGVLVVREGIVVQSFGFERYLPIGSPAIAVEYLNRWGIDEIVLLDIDATYHDRGPNKDMIVACSRRCQVPLAVGGGIRRVDDIKEAIHAGADKIVINAAALGTPSLISEGAQLFGRQCIVVSIDARRIDENRYELFVNSGKSRAGYSPAEFARKAEECGAGEILVNSIDRDGSKKGYDLDLIGQIIDAVHIPVIACGGVGHPRHFLDAMRLGASAVAAANFFHFTEHSVITAKRWLEAAKCDVRLDTYATYSGFSFDGIGRVAKLDDPILEKLRFEYIPEEVI